VSPFGRRRPKAGSGRRVLVAFTGGHLDPVVLAAALRIARAEDAALVPAYLIIVPLSQPFDGPLVREVEQALPVLEGIEQEATRAGIEVDARMERGRSLRDALARLWSEEHFDRVILPADPGDRQGFSPADLAWALTNTPTETIVLRPAPAEAA